MLATLIIFLREGVEASMMRWRHGLLSLRAVGVARPEVAS
jgi:hypothetical protein